MLITKNLSFCYPGGASMLFPDITMRQSELLLLQGASGAGKSTLLALLCGLIHPAGGSLIALGQDLGALTGSQRDAWRGRHVGFLPQKLHLSASLTVREQLGLVYFAAGLPEQAARIDTVLSTLGLADLQRRRPSELSGGQAQRVALARAVLLSPQLILADEPTANLDDVAAANALDLLLQAAQHCAASLLIATHDGRVLRALDAAGRTAQRVVLARLLAPQQEREARPIA